MPKLRSHVTQLINQQESLRQSLTEAPPYKLNTRRNVSQTLFYLAFKRFTRIYLNFQWWSKTVSFHVALMPAYQRNICIWARMVTEVSETFNLSPIISWLVMNNLWPFRSQVRMKTFSTSDNFIFGLIELQPSLVRDCPSMRLVIQKGLLYGNLIIFTCFRLKRVIRNEFHSFR